MRQKTLVGTITGIGDSALDGVQARRIRRTECGYTVELFASKGAFHKGRRVLLSVTAFTMNKWTMHYDLPVVL